MIQYSVHTSAADLDLTYTISTSEGIGRYLAKSRLFYVMVDLRECSNKQKEKQQQVDPNLSLVAAGWLCCPFFSGTITRSTKQHDLKADGIGAHETCFLQRSVE